MDQSSHFLKLHVLVYKHFQCAPEPEVPFRVADAAISLAMMTYHSFSLTPVFLMESPSPINPCLKPLVWPSYRLRDISPIRDQITELFAFPNPS